MKTTKQIIVIVAMFLSAAAFAQKPTVAVLNIDSKGLIQDSKTMGYLVRLELEKTSVYSVMDKYEVAEVLTKNKIDAANCYSKTCLVETGKLLGADKMISGDAERVDEKIVINLRLIDVKSGTIEKSDATEYLNLPEVQKMVEISVKKLVGIVPDKAIVEQLIDYDVPIQSPKNTLRLSGPRMGCSYTTGNAGKLKTSNEGLDMFPVTFDFGWQQEFQYISAGNFQALVENVVLISGLESHRFIPSYSPLMGFRFGEKSYEFAFGPTFRIQNGFSSGLVVAVGKTFHSGYLNIPVNLYFAPIKGHNSNQNGTNIGITFGFNIQKKKLHK